MMSSNESESSKNIRIISGVGECLQRRFGPVRMVGTVDIDGYGTSHNITEAEVDPFLLSDYVKMGAGIKPPFCAHPHAGACVMSIPLEGYDIQPWDNLHGDEEDLLEAGGAYMLQSGLGCVHDEPNIILPSPCKKVDPITGKSQNDGTIRRFFQVWTNPGVYGETLPPPKSKVARPDMVPVVRDGDSYARVLVGKYLGVDGALQVDTWPSTTILHVTIPQGKQGSISIPAEYNAHILVETGTASFVGRCKQEAILNEVGGLCGDKDSQRMKEYSNCRIDMAHSEFKLLLSQPHSAEDTNVTCPRLQVYNASKDISKEKHSEEESFKEKDQGDLQLMVFMGIPHKKQFYKLLGYGGALVHKSEELVRALMVEYEKNPKEFGRDASAMTLPPNTSNERYEMIEGYREKGDNERPGLLGRWKERETMPANQVERACFEV